MHIVFNKPLAIFGLGLESEEVFLRWLLIERAKYFERFRDRSKPAWYFYTDDEQSRGKILLLENVGISPIRVSCYEELYERPWGGR